jgi:hypothetical protein
VRSIGTTTAPMSTIRPSVVDAASTATSEVLLVGAALVVLQVFQGSQVTEARVARNEKREPILKLGHRAREPSQRRGSNPQPAPGKGGQQQSVVAGTVKRRGLSVVGPMATIARASSASLGAESRAGLVSTNG